MGSAIGMLNSNYLEDLSHEEFSQSEPNFPESRQLLISTQGDRILLSLISGEPLVALDGQHFLKSVFLFGDAIHSLSQTKPKKEDWCFTLAGQILYLPKMTRDYPLSTFFNATHPRKMAWDLTPSCQGRPGRIIYNNGSFHIAPDGAITPFRDLLQGITSSEDSSLIQPVLISSFANAFMGVGGLYPLGNPRFCWIAVTPQHSLDSSFSLDDGILQD